MTINELHETLGRLIADGHGQHPVLFDTEAKAYDYHMATVDYAVHETEPRPHLALHENSRPPEVSPPPD